MKLVMLADDLTGALDSGVQLAKNGIKTIATGNLSCRPEDYSGKCAALVLNTDSRHDTAEQAYEKAFSLISRFKPNTERLYIKTDSALRGNISAAMAAAVDATNGALMFVPAFPAMRRATLGGIHYIDGVPLKDSHFRNDPLNPATKSSVADIVSADYPVNTISVPRGKDNIDFEHGKLVYIFDCETDDDIKLIASSLADLKLLRLTAGCAGFATALSLHLNAPALDSAPVGNGIDRLFIISGSANDVSADQITIAEKGGIPIIHISPEMVMGENGDTLADEAVKRIAELFKTHGTVVAATVRNRTDAHNASVYSDSRNIPENLMHELISRRISGLAHAVLETCTCNLAVFGGDTTLAVLNELGCSDIEPQAEIEIGVPLSLFRFRERDLLLITKSGGLGGINVIENMAHYIANQ